MIFLRSIVWLARLFAAVLVVIVLPGTGKAVGALLLVLVIVVTLIATRRTLENVAAGFSLGRSTGARKGTRISCGGCEGVVGGMDDDRVARARRRRPADAPALPALRGGAARPGRPATADEA